MSTVSTISEMTLDGGMPCLDLVNSGLDTQKGEEVERIYTYDDLLILTGRVRLLDKSVLRQLTKQAAQEPANAVKALQKLWKARQVMQQLFDAIADGEPDKLDPLVLHKFNAYISQTVKQQQFVVYKKELVLSYNTTYAGLDLPLTLFLVSAYELLTTRQQTYIRRCAKCQWLFLDETKSHRRKWCNMQECGSIEKSRRYYNRKKLNESSN
jgi:predicted RNA-binding Zn ribbon-like protein